MKNFMELISFLGNTPVIIMLCSLILFSISFKKGLVIINVIGWTAMLTVFAKEQINFPRPIDVDTRLQSSYEPLDYELNESAPVAFWEIFSQELLSKTRTDEFKRYGFPSGHASIQTAMWVSLLFLFRSRWVLICGIVIVILTGLSRLYLGSHFLADVIAGTLLGALVSLSMIQLVKRSRYLQVNTHDLRSLTLLWLPALLFLFSAFLPVWIIGSLMGINGAAILLILKRNFPVFHVILWKRILAAIIGLIAVIATFYFIPFIAFSNFSYTDALLIAVANYLAVYGSLSLSRRLNLIRFRH
jgi:membrane-associated phospholipid phosphatase